MNVLIDPYAYFRTTPIEGISKHKSQALHHDRLMHVAALKAGSVDCLILGSSRLTEGFPRSHIAYQDCDMVHNAGLAGPTMREVRNLLDVGLRHSKLRRVWLGLDLFMFNANRHDSRGSAEQLYSSSLADRVLMNLRVATSLDTLLDSLQTIGQQVHPAFHGDNGFANEEHLSIPLKLRSTRATFLRGVRGYIVHELPPPAYEFTLRSTTNDPLADLEHIVRTATYHDVQLHVFINPAHVWQWELLDALDLWDEWDDWKRKLVKLHSAMVSSEPYTRFPLWDFSGYHAFSREPVPLDPQLRSGLSQFWDPSHYKERLGRMVLNRLMEDQDNGENFGILITDANIESHLKAVRHDALQWRNANEFDVAAVRAVVACFAPRPLVDRLSRISATDEKCGELVAMTR